MKATELRLGNLLRTTVTHIELKYDCERDFDQIEPIPLTEEWLVKLGLKCDYLKSYSIKIGKDYTEGQIIFSINFLTKKMQITIGNGGEDCDWIFLTIPDFVHSFQNLYFALTGEELTIK